VVVTETSVEAAVKRAAEMGRAARILNMDTLSNR
jgi:hypothetical protein